MKLILENTCIELARGEYECRRVPYNWSNKRMHWRLRSKWNHAWKDAVRSAYLTIVLAPGKNHIKRFEQASVIITLHKFKLFDRDGAYSSIKPVLDGLVEVEIIKDDSPKYIDLEVNQIKVAHQHLEKVEIEVLERE